MRFAGNTSNVGSYIQAGRAGAKGAADFFKVARANAPDYGGLAEANMNSRSAERIAATQAEAAVAKAGLEAKADVKTTRIRTEAEGKILDKKIDAKRKAGMVGMFGAVAGGALMGVENNQAKARQKKRDAEADAREAAKWAYLQGQIDNTPQAPELKPWQAGTPPTTTAYQTKPYSSESGSGDTSTTTASPGTTLQGNQKIVADAIAKYESGDWGYEAFNQGGAAGGTKVVGKSGSHKNIFGRSLTDMTLGEIFKKQNTKQQGMSMQEHLDSGGLHAVGRYQFIGSTLQDEVNKMGLSLDTKFTPEVQDQIFISHIKRVGNISPWVGPMQNYSSSEKANFNSMITGF